MLQPNGDPTGINLADETEEKKEWGLTETQDVQTQKQKERYRELAAKGEPYPLKVQVREHELDLEIDPFVANPDIMNSSWQTVNWLTEHSGMIEGRVVADMGTGSGVLGLVAAELGAKHVYMPDIEERAVNCAAKNIGKNDLQEICEAFQSDLFEGFGDRPPAEVHIFNHPFFSKNPAEGEEESWEDMMFGKEGLVDRYLEEIRRTSPDAVVIMPWFTLANKEDGNDNDPRNHASAQGFEFEEYHQPPVSRGVQQGEFIIYVLRQKEAPEENEPADRGENA